MLQRPLLLRFPQCVGTKKRGPSFVDIVRVNQGRYSMYLLFTLVFNNLFFTITTKNDDDDDNNLKESYKYSHMYGTICCRRFGKECMLLMMKGYRLSVIYEISSLGS